MIRKRQKKEMTALLTAAMLAFAAPLTVLAEEPVLDITEQGPAAAIVSETTAAAISADVVEVTTTETAAAVQESTAAVSENNSGSSTGTAGVNLAKLTADSSTQSIGSSIDSKYAVVFDLDANRIVAEKNADAQVYPASMTKIMTLLVCAEHLPDLNEKLTITQDIVDYINAHDASNCGFAAGEQVTVKDLLYGVIMPSGADAVMALTRRIAGSDAAFVEMMNQKAKELGLSDGAHFVNATGLYNAEHHLTVKDVAQILNAAMANATAREVLSAHTYQTENTNKHSSGIKFSNLFLRRIEDQKLGGATVVAAKTGYVSQSMFCAASYGTSASGKHYIVVTDHGSSTWQCIYDQAALYSSYAK